MAVDKHDTKAALSGINPAEKIKEAVAGGIEIDEGFDAAQRSLNGTVVSFNHLVSLWQGLAETAWPLGANRVGESVSLRFAAMGSQFSGMLRDYLGKLSAANATLQDTRNAYGTTDTDLAGLFSQQHLNAMETVDSLDRFASTPLGFSEYATGWSPVDRTDWSAYDSHQLAEFARGNNNPAELGKAVDTWMDRLKDLETHSAEFAGTIGHLGSAWKGPAADAAHAALTPLWQWTGDAAGNAGRIRENLRLAGDAAERVRQLPDPMAEPSLGEELHAFLASSPTELSDLRARQLRAQAVKDEQVRYLEQYETAMAGVYDALPEFHLAPVATSEVEEPARSTGPGVGYQPRGVEYSAGSSGTAVQVPDNPGESAGSGDSGATVVPTTETPSRGTTVAATYTTAGLADTTGVRPVGAQANPTGGWNSGGFLPGIGGIAAGGGLAGGTPGDARSSAGPSRTVTPAVSARAAGAHAFGPAGTRPDREEDREHDRAGYLVERDPEGTFGTAEPTAPPVIGA